MVPTPVDKQVDASAHADGEVSVSLDKTRRALVEQTAILLIIVGGIAVIAAARVTTLSAVTAVVSAFAIAIFCASIALARSRWPVQVAAHFLLASWLVALFGVALLRGGLSAPLMIAVPTVPVIAATLISRRAAWLVCGAISLGLVLLCVVESVGAAHWSKPTGLDPYIIMRAFWVAASSLMATQLATYITMRNERLTARLERLASTDALTGLNNRRAISVLLDTEVLRARRSRQPVSVLMLDIDHFKALNDAHGHLAGDLALRRIADAITATLRTGGDAVGRWGGEEFLVVLPNTYPRDAQRIAERARRSIAELKIPKRTDGPEHITVSIGIAGGQNIADAGQLLHSADLALYSGKTNGRNRVEVGIIDDSRRRPATQSEPATLKSSC